MDAEGRRIVFHHREGIKARNDSPFPQGDYNPVRNMYIATTIKQGGKRLSERQRLSFEGHGPGGRGDERGHGWAWVLSSAGTPLRGLLFK